MRGEYLLFDALVLVPVIALSFWRPSAFFHRWPAAWAGVGAAAVPFLAWDAAVTGRHWWFNERYITGLSVGPLPIEEVLFFAAMPFACLFSWHTLFGGGAEEPRRSLAPLPFALGMLLPVGAGVLVLTKLEYTGLVLVALGACALVDRFLGGRVLERPGFLRLWLFVIAATTLFNGYLTARPVVLYDDSYDSGLRVWTIPVEDYGFGAALVLLAATVYLRLVKAKERGTEAG